jgi:hypothetical protein
VRDKIDLVLKNTGKGQMPAFDQVVIEFMKTANQFEESIMKNVTFDPASYEYTILQCKLTTLNIF